MTSPSTPKGPDPEGPNIPFLLGTKNLEEWKNKIMHAMAYNNLERHMRDYIAQPGGAAEAAVWHRERLNARILIKTSLALIRDMLVAEGWDEDEPDPKLLFEAIGDLTAAMDELPVSTLMNELCHIDCLDFSSLAKYQSRAVFLKHILAQMDCSFSDTALTWVVINGLENKYPRWYQDLCRAMAAGSLDWEKLMRAISTRAIKEPQEKEETTAREEKQHKSTDSMSWDAGPPTSPKLKGSPKNNGYGPSGRESTPFV
ncbi:hypothetical protein NKR23_g8113 [Pleurostoma richardsiae]|uniref:Uncharacterized protein n=1 Tax=Pleurostoma richardsiae TaxID=41990 RepID=A0AA38R903_9PEZI|nr:hypothetical protein NKR23_g8113 [Pleurostoma richardsiae]